LERTRRRERTTCGQLADRFLADYERTLKDSSIAYTGVRPGEMVALEWRDVDLRNGRLQVRRRLYQGKLDYPKTGPRMVALVPQARDALTGRPRLGVRVHFEAPPSPVLRLTSLVVLAARVCGRFGRKVDLYELRHFCGHYLYVVCDLPSRVVAA
jgi:integrase